MRPRFDPLPDEELTRRLAKYRSSRSPKRVVVYTALVGGYDDLITPEFLNDDYDFVCFSDSMIEGDHPWKIVPIDYHNADQTRISRFYKLHPHYFFVDYDVAIWIDANILIREDMGSLVDRFQCGSNLIATFEHPDRNCLFDEIQACSKWSKDDAELLKKQRRRYLQAGVPRGLGLPETNVFMSKPGDPRTVEFFERWWKEMDNGSRRDQVSVMPVLHAMGEDFTRLVDSREQTARHDTKRFLLFSHKRGWAFLRKLNYRVPAFLRDAYANATKRWWEQAKGGELKNAAFLQFRSRFVDIVIPVHNAIDDVKACLESVAPTLEANHRLIIVDDGSDAPTRDYLQDFAAGRENVTLIRHDLAQRYTKAANAGLRASTAEYVVLLNSDTIVPPQWLLKLLHCAESADEIGIVGPLSNAASWQSIPEMLDAWGSMVVNALPGDKSVSDMDALCQDLSLDAFPRVHLINGFCFCIKRRVIEKIGYLDEETFPKGYGEENDYCFRATDAGFVHAVATHTYVYHAKSKSYTSAVRLVLSAESAENLTRKYDAARIQRSVKSDQTHPLIERMRNEVQGELQAGKAASN
ncbi:Glycosyl transferase, family 2 [Blastopirellula marina DSM 3645]|uniref:Glycosyl transferase, family 2 n=2 Tax=Blastopirellula marina TaxID=124 RepID=A3ZPD6_9BACT|nr:Glycosyl transferase, family 2 [Blastopirellula marina DSM 3645]